MLKPAKPELPEIVTIASMVAILLIGAYFEHDGTGFAIVIALSVALVLLYVHWLCVTLPKALDKARKDWVKYYGTEDGFDD